jgi:methionyl-tRNA formyltransferase
MKKIKLLWLSANLLGYELFKKVITNPNTNCIGIITLSGKSKTVMYDGVPSWRWKKFNIPIFEIENINEEVGLIKSLRPDLIIACSWRQIIKDEILKLPPRGIIGFHPTLLPRGRGPCPIINSILNDYKESGLTMFYLESGLDCGNIIGQKKFRINSNDHADDVYKKVIRAGKKIIEQYLPLVLQKKYYKGIKQDLAKTTFFKKITYNDNEILPTDSLFMMHKKIRAFSKPYLGAFLKKGRHKLVIWKAELKND